mgnify:CR=1 FL=1
MQEYATTFSVKRLWTILAVGMFVMFGVLLLMGRQIYQLAPPIPEAVTAKNGETLFTRADIETGQNVWQSIGGMEQGSIWGHGSYLAPDWTADWLHGEATQIGAPTGCTAKRRRCWHCRHPMLRQAYPRRKPMPSARLRCRTRCVPTPMTPHRAS